MSNGSVLSFTNSHMNILSGAYCCYTAVTRSIYLHLQKHLAYLIQLRSLTSNADSSYDTRVPWVSHEHYDMQRHSCYMNPTTHNTLLRENFDNPPTPAQSHNLVICFTRLREHAYQKKKSQRVSFVFCNIKLHISFHIFVQSSLLTILIENQLLKRFAIPLLCFLSKISTCQFRSSARNSQFARNNSSSDRS